MYKVLIFGMTPNPGGVESFIMSYYRRIDKKKIGFDFLCNSYQKVAYEDEIISLGGKIYKIPMRSKHPIKYRKELKKFFKKFAPNYDCIWVNVNSLANIDYLKLAKKYGIKKRIIHSHNSQNMDGKIRGLLHLYNKKRISKYATNYWACSKSAAKWFYDDSLISKVIIIKNAIDLSKVKFNGSKRKIIREKFNLQDDFVIGNIGRLHFQKNQSFAISVLSQLIKVYPNTKLLLIGDGSDKDKLISQVKKLNLENNVIFAGVQSDISGYLSSMDLFLFPSKFEGLPIAGLEAQGNGIPILASSTAISKEAILNSNVNILLLSAKKEVWIRKIIEIRNSKRVASDTINKNFNRTGYNVVTAVHTLEKQLLYMEKNK